jgi:protein ImuB
MQRSNSSGSTSPKNREAEIGHILSILHKWGIHTLGQLAALDKEQLAARLGPEAIHMWERAKGQSSRVLKLVRPSESFQESFEFENEIETSEPLLFMLRRFVEQLALRLDAIYLVAKELTLVITFANPPHDRTQDGFVRRRNGSAATPKKQIYERVFQIPQPTNDVDLLFRMLQTHLENFKSEYPIVAVALSAQPIKPAREQFGLFETTLRNPYQLLETLARFIALLGADRVGTPVLEETHRPDAFRIEPFSWTPTSAAGNGGRSSATPVPHPEARRSSPLHILHPALRRFRQAASASVLMDGDKPAHVRSPEFRGNIIEHRGPYFISGNWWDEKSWMQTEWDLQLENGELVRVHESPTSPSSGVASEGSWKVDGVYD